MKQMYSVGLVCFPSFFSKRRLAGRLSLLLLGGVAATSHAATITWTNNTPGNWNTAANWSPNQVPGAADTAVLANGVSVTLGSPTTVSNFNFSAGAIKGNGPLTV